MDDRVIPDVMNDVFYPKEATLSFILISLIEAYKEWGDLEDVEGS